MKEMKHASASSAKAHNILIVSMSSDVDTCMVVDNTTAC